MLPSHHNIVLGISCYILVVSGEYNLHLLHVNDIHSRFDQTDKYSGRCSSKEAANEECFGGVARLKKVVDDLKDEHGNVIFVNGGDFYQGTIWYTKFKWKVVSKFANLLNFTAMSPGNHEFDDGLAGFLPFLKNATFPMICCNIDDSELPESQRISTYIKKSKIVEIDGRRIGIIGYVLPETKQISQPGKVKFLDEITSIDKEAKNLKAKGVNIIIAVGHSGFEKDQEIAKNVPDVDVVVGGHSNTFLYNGQSPSSPEKSVGPYPFLVNQTNGKIVPVVQAYAYAKYLGHLVLTFDEGGKLIYYDGNPILLKQDFPQDETVLMELRPWQREVLKFSKEIIGTVKTSLVGDRSEESTLGNFVTDAIVNYYATKLDITTIAMINSGGMRAKSLGNDITMEDLLNVFPYENSIDVMELRGGTIRKVMEKSAKLLSPEKPNTGGGFIQVSGIRLTLDHCKNPEETRITKLQVKHNNNYEDLQDSKIYKVAMNTYLANGGDNYTEIKKDRLNYMTGDLDTDVLKTFIEQKCPTESNQKNRINIICGSGAEEGYNQVSNEEVQSDITNLCDTKNNNVQAQSGQGIPNGNHILTIFFSLAVSFMRLFQ